MSVVVVVVVVMMVVVVVVVMMVVVVVVVMMVVVVVVFSITFCDIFIGMKPNHFRIVHCRRADLQLHQVLPGW